MIVYDPHKKKLFINSTLVEEDFYVGDYIDEISLILVQLKYIPDITDVSKSYEDILKIIAKKIQDICDVEKTLPNNYTWKEGDQKWTWAKDESVPRFKGFKINRQAVCNKLNNIKISESNDNSSL